jgi:hypothetical protein
LTVRTFALFRHLVKAARELLTHAISSIEAPFRPAGRDLRLQRVQLDLACEDFRRSFATLQIAAPEVQSERGRAFMLDVANQYGDSVPRRSPAPCAPRAVGSGPAGCRRPRAN